MTDDLAIYKHHRVEAHELLSEFRCSFNEPWGDTMHWWFMVADELVPSV